MREIKFRAWLKKENKMAEMSNICNINFDKNKLLIVFCGDIVHKEIDFKDVELIQFTGLKDKNGKDVYEGDIIRCISEDDTETSAIIKYGKFKDENYEDDFMLGWYIELFDYEENRNMQLSIFNGDSSKTILDICEVIGNIYDNKELLEGE